MARTCRRSSRRPDSIDLVDLFIAFEVDRSITFTRPQLIGIMSNAEWSVVLDAFYENELRIEPIPLHEYPGDDSISDHTGLQFLADNTGLTMREIWSELTFLEEVGLIEKIVSNSGIYIGLTEKGFEVAHEREHTESQQEISRKSARLSAYLVLAIALQVVLQIISQQNWESVAIGVLVVLVILLVWTELR